MLVKKQKGDEIILNEEIIKAIQQADDFLIRDVINAVIHRYAQIFPEWEVMFLTLHKEPKARAKDIKAHIKFLKNHEKPDSLGLNCSPSSGQ